MNVNKPTLASAFVMAVALVFLVLAPEANAATLVVDDDLTCSGATFPTISSAVAVASPGDTIKVCAGTYNELVNVNKQLTILGAQAGVDARTRPGVPATESVVNGLAGSTSFYVTANGVKIDGFTVQNATNGNVFGAGIVLAAGTTGSQVLNNIIQNNLVGLFLANSGAQPVVIQRNLFRNNTQPGPAGGHGIYADEFVSGGPVTNVSIDSNKFELNTWGIGISNTGATQYSGLNITGNTFNANSRGMYFFGTTFSTISCNVITNQARYGIGFFDNVDLTLVENNRIENNAQQGVWVVGAPGTNSGLGVSNNNIAGNLIAGLEVTAGSYTGLLNAVNNWWGSATGPTNPNNPGGTGDKVIDPDNVVDFTPWSTSSQADADNDGILDACDSQIGPPTNKDQCKNGGWQNFNFPRTFKNQGDCIQYVNTGK